MNELVEALKVAISSDEAVLSSFVERSVIEKRLAVNKAALAANDPASAPPPEPRKPHAPKQPNCTICLKACSTHRRDGHCRGLDASDPNNVYTRPVGAATA